MEEAILNLKWESFSSQLTSSLDECYENQSFVDLSLVCKNGTTVKCHKIVLANASSLFRRLLLKNEHPHPMIILHDIEADDLKTIVNFMYCGEIQVVKSEVRRILKIAEMLEVSGLKDIRTRVLVPEANNIDREASRASGSVENPLKMGHTRNLTKNCADEAATSNFGRRALIGGRNSERGSFENPEGASGNVRKLSFDDADYEAMPGNSKRETNISENSRKNTDGTSGFGRRPPILVKSFANIGETEGNNARKLVNDDSEDGFFLAANSKVTPRILRNRRTNNAERDNSRISGNVENSFKLVDQRSLMKNSIDAAEASTSGVGKRVPITGKNVFLRLEPGAEECLKPRNDTKRRENFAHTRTSRAESVENAKRKRKCRGETISWNRVFSDLYQENEIPLTKLCMMDEVEISATMPGASVENSSSLQRPAEECETSNSSSNNCVYIKQEVDIPSDSECEFNNLNCETQDSGENNSSVPSPPMELYKPPHKTVHCTSGIITLKPKLKTLSDLLTKSGSR